MAGLRRVIVLIVFQIFLLGFISGDCPTHCNECKEIPSGPYMGTWNLIERNSPSCTTNEGGNTCLYQRLEDNQLMCMCDPGTELYTPCEDEDWVNGLCYQVQAIDNKLNHFLPVQYNNSILNCRAACLDKFPHTIYYGVAAIGVTFATACICRPADQPPVSPHHLRVNQSMCDQTCPGNPLEFCGAVTVINIYAINPLIAHPVNGLCYNNTAYPWIEQVITSLAYNDVFRCRAYCMLNLANIYFGLQGGDQCLCGNLHQPTEEHRQVSQALCNIPCPGNSLEFCGGTEVANLYRIHPLH